MQPPSAEYFSGPNHLAMRAPSSQPHITGSPTHAATGEVEQQRQHKVVYGEIQETQEIQHIPVSSGRQDSVSCSVSVRSEGAEESDSFDILDVLNLEKMRSGDKVSTSPVPAVAQPAAGSSRGMEHDSSQQATAAAAAAEAVADAQAEAQAEAQETASTDAAVNLTAVGHSAYQDLAYWPEMLEVHDDLARSRHTAVYLAHFNGMPVAVKVCRYPTVSVDGGGGGGSSAGDVVLEQCLSLQYRLCHMSHKHILQQIAVFPRIYEVSRAWLLPL